MKTRIFVSTRGILFKSKGVGFDGEPRVKTRYEEISAKATTMELEELTKFVDAQVQFEEEYGIVFDLGEHELTEADKDDLMKYIDDNDLRKKGKIVYRTYVRRTTRVSYDKDGNATKTKLDI